MLMQRTAPAWRRQRGLSLVEMMVGVAIGLFIVAAAGVLVSTQLNENRRLLLETQVQQDLRATADIIARELRRAGYNDLWHESIWTADDTSTDGPAPNPQAAVVSSNSEVEFSYHRTASEQQFGFKLQDGRIKTRLGAAWQDLTDRNTLLVSRFDVTERGGPVVRMSCPKLCADGTESCWPTVQVRDVEIAITGNAVTAPEVQRTVTSRARLRSDAVVFNVAASPAPNRICP
jgi:prepilin-type N-terminal cleavage/methylation domain-containing protein